MTTLSTRRRTTAATAVVFGAVDLAQKTTAGPSLEHGRSAPVLLLMAFVVLALVVLVPKIPWLPVAVGAGIAAGGTAGNLVSLLIWSHVPDPLVLRGAAGGIAFNLADVFVIGGDALLLCSAAVYALRNRDRLRLPV